VHYQTSSPGKPPRPVSSSSARRSSSSGPPSAGGRRASASVASPQQRGSRRTNNDAVRTPSKLLGSTLGGTLGGTSRGTRGGIASPSPLARTAGGGGFFGQSDAPIGASHSSALAAVNSKAGVKEKMRARAWAAFARKTVFLTLDDLPKEARPRTARKGGVTPFCLQLTKVLHCICKVYDMCYILLCSMCSICICIHRGCYAVYTNTAR
jgi:hypothetical protein